MNYSGIDRRCFLKGAAALAASCAFGDFSFAADGAKPNIVLIVADDLGWRDLSCYGDSNYLSPAADRIAAEGVKFTNAFVTSASCSPSRASIMTGQAPHSVNVLGLTHKHPKYQMSSKVPTLAEALRRKGYKTAIAGKWHVAPYRPVASYGYETQLDVMEIKNSDKVLGFIEENKNEPFFVELNYFQTHRPNLGGPEYAQHPDFPVSPDEIHVPDYWRIPDSDDADFKRDLAGYYSQARWMDYMVGEVMDGLDSRGLSDNTLVVYVSDNGPNYPGVKATCYDRGIGVPMMMRMPGKIPAGKVVDSLVSTIDIMPTCLDAVGVSVPKTAQGTSLLPLINGRTQTVHDAIYSEITYHVLYTPVRSIRTTEYKYINNLSEDQYGLDLCEDFTWAQKMSELPGQKCCVNRLPEELYDLRKDPHEENNLAADPDYAGIKKELFQRLAAWRAETGDPFPNI